ncbi:MAG: phytoene desaturase family protein [Candidatus Thorarchaeota archaeon]
MTKKSIIIIGAGLGGLSTGVYAQMNGYSTQIFELNSGPGGVATCWKRKDYLIDGGIHFLSGCKPGLGFYEIMKEIGAENVPMVDFDFYSRFIDEASGRIIDITADLDKLDRDLTELFPEDVDIIKELISATRSLAKMDLSVVGFGKPIELSGKLDTLREYWQMRGLMKYMMGKWNLPVKKYVERVKDPLFNEILRLMFLPEVPMWFIVMILSQLASGQMTLLEEGSLSFIKAIEQRFLNLGGAVNYNSEVEKIIVKDDKAIGIRLKDESEYFADYIIPAMDGHSVIYDFLEGKYVDEKIEHRYTKWELGRPLVMINFGVTRKFEEVPSLLFLKTDPPITIGDSDLDGIMVRIFNYGKGFAPSGKTVVQVEFEHEWAYWYNLRTSDRDAYRKEKDRIASESLKRLETHFPGISEQVEVTDVATPYTMWRYTRNLEGAYMAWLPTSKLMTLRLRKTLPGLEGLYMAGQWAMGMGSVPTAIYSGRQAIQLVCHHDGKKFRAAQT